jgi:hypothetical protein
MDPLRNIERYNLDEINKSLKHEKLGSWIEKRVIVDNDERIEDED